MKYGKEHLLFKFVHSTRFLEFIKGKKWCHFFDHQRSFAFYRNHWVGQVAPSFIQKRNSKTSLSRVMTTATLTRKKEEELALHILYMHTAAAFWAWYFCLTEINVSTNLIHLLNWFQYWVFSLYWLHWLKFYYR